MTSSQRSIRQSGLRSAVSSVKSARGGEVGRARGSPGTKETKPNSSRPVVVRGGHGHVGAAVPRAVREPAQLARLADLLRPRRRSAGRRRGTRPAGVCAQAPCGSPSWGGSAAKRQTKRSTGGMGAEAYPRPGTVQSRQVSRRSVTGPSLTSSTAISAPNTPRGGAEAIAEALVERLGVLRPGGGDVRRAVAPARVAVERELRDAEHLAIAERLVHPPVARRGRRAARAPCRRACPPRSGPSSWVTPSSTSRPGPIAATRSPPTLTDARLTRWIERAHQTRVAPTATGSATAVVQAIAAALSRRCSPNSCASTTELSPTGVAASST